jgi:hypothetical protein
MIEAAELEESCGNMPEDIYREARSNDTVLRMRFPCVKFRQNSGFALKVNGWKTTSPLVARRTKQDVTDKGDATLLKSVLRTWSISALLVGQLQKANLVATI